MRQMPRAPRTSSELAELPTEALHPRAARLDTMPPEAIAALMLGEEAKAVRAARGCVASVGSSASSDDVRGARGIRPYYGLRKPSTNQPKS